MDAEVLAEARATKAKHLLPYQVDLVVGVTSRSNVVSDRRPDQERKAGTKCRAANVGLWRTVRLPHPFGFEISTEHWDHWDD